MRVWGRPTSTPLIWFVALRFPLRPGLARAGRPLVGLPPRFPPASPSFVLLSTFRPPLPLSASRRLELA